MSNTAKYQSYKVAWDRIAAAIEQGFFLEAVAIQESIIFDRLRSFVSFVDSAEIPDKTPLSVLLNRWEANLNLSSKRNGLWDNDPELISRLRAWGDSRNKVVHTIVRSMPGQPTRDVGEFLLHAEQTAVEGARLAREVSDWFRKQKSKSPA